MHMGILDAFCNSFEGVFSNKKAFVIPVTMFAITLLGLVAFLFAFQGSSPGGDYGLYGSPTSGMISLPILGYVSYAQLAELIIFVVFILAISIFSALAITAQAYDIINNKIMSLGKVFSKTLRRFPVAFAANTLVILLYVVTFAVIILLAAFVSSVLAMGMYGAAVIFAVLLVEVVLFFCLFLLIIYYSIFFYFINTAIVAEDKGVISSIRRSIELSKGRMTNIFGAIALSNIVTIMTDSAFYMPLVLILGLGAGFGLGVFGGYGGGPMGGLGGMSILPYVFGVASLLGSNMVIMFAVLIGVMFFFSAWTGMIPMYLYTEFAAKNTRHAKQQKRKAGE